MYHYSLYDQCIEIILKHTEKFSQEQFEQICKEVPLLECEGFKNYDELAICNHLINRYGFQQIEPIAEFYLSYDDESEME